MTWHLFLQWLGPVLEAWWPRLVIIGSILSGTFLMLNRVTGGLLWAVIKAGVLGRAQDHAEGQLIRTLNDNIAALLQQNTLSKGFIEEQEKRHSAAIATVRSQVAEMIAEKDAKILTLTERVDAAEAKSKRCQEECTRLKAEVDELRGAWEAAAQGNLAQWDRRQTRAGTLEDRRDPAAPQEHDDGH